MASTNIQISIFFFTIFFSSTLALNISSTNSLNPNLSSIRSFCQSTPYPDSCFDSLKLSISVNIRPDILTYLLQTLDTALSEAAKLTSLFSDGGTGNNIIEKQRGTLQDCKEFHDITLSSLKKTVSRIKDSDSRKLSDARVYLSAALTNKNTCLEGLDSAFGPSKPVIINSLISTYKHVSNSLSMLPKSGKGHRNRRLSRRILRGIDDDYDPSEVIIVAADGTGNFSTIGDAIRFAPNKSNERIMIYVREGVYEENCSILATDELYGNSSRVKSYLGRPWRVFSTTVFLESYIYDFIHPNGWSKWFRDEGLGTLYYGEYNNYGPGLGTDNRVTWPGYHIMDYGSAYNFTVSELITGEAWLDSTLFPYDYGI